MNVANLHLIWVEAMLVAEIGEAATLATWRPLTPYSIQRDSTAQIWHAGHVTDVLDAGNGALIISADKGGVWRVASDGSARSLSDSWSNPDVLCLAQGPDGSQHLFAGASGGLFSGGALWMTDVTSSDPLGTWLPLPIPANTGGVVSVLPLLGTGSRHIVIACQNGLWWSTIPQSSRPQGYTWTQITQAQGLPPGYYVPFPEADMLAEGPDDTFIITVYGKGLCKGVWVNGAVQLQPVIYSGGNSILVYGGTQLVTALIPYAGGVMTAFSGDAVYYSPDGHNLGGGGNTTRPYHGTLKVIATAPYQNGVIAAFESGEIYLSPDGQHLNQQGVDLTQWHFGSVASCAGNRAYIYAVGSDANDFDNGLYAFLASTDGGQTWSQVLNPQVVNNSQNGDLVGAAEHLGWYDNCLAVSPANASLVALGWLGGAFVTQDGGQSWRQYKEEANTGNVDYSPALHADYHAVRFSSDGQRLYIGTDGGVAGADVQLGSSMPPTLKNFTSRYNEHLATLQFAGMPSRGIYGVFSANGSLVAGGLQDNGNVYCNWLTGSPWTELAGGDGDVSLLVANSDLLFNNNSSVTQTSRAEWNGTTFTQVGTVPNWLGGNSFDANGISGMSGHDLVVDSVVAPTLLSQYDGAHSILAVAGVLNWVYGLFEDNVGPVYQHWETLGTLPLTSDAITAVGSYDGLVVLAGTASGRIWRLNPGNGLAPAELSPFTGGQVINRLIVDASSQPALRAYALAGNQVCKLIGASVQGNSGIFNRFSTPGPGTVFDLATDWTQSPPTLFACTDSQVYLSPNEGVTWAEASSGLPAVPHCAGLRVLGGRIFLSTWGRSAWLATVPPELSFGPPSAHGITLQWRSGATNFVLEQSTTLPGTNWVDVPYAPVDNGTNMTVILSTDQNRTLFFRLHAVQ